MSRRARVNRNLRRNRLRWTPEVLFGQYTLSMPANTVGNTQVQQVIVAAGTALPSSLGVTAKVGNFFGTFTCVVSGTSVPLNITCYLYIMYIPEGVGLPTPANLQQTLPALHPEWVIAQSVAQPTGGNGFAQASPYILNGRRLKRNLRSGDGIHLIAVWQNGGGSVANLEFDYNLRFVFRTN